MKIQVNGKEVEAYHLIMRKENALEILNGTKETELREFSKKYGEMFIDKKKEAEYFEKMKQPDFEYVDKNGIAECDKVYKDVKYVYFTNYNKFWYLIAEIAQIYMLWFTDDDMDFLSNELNCKDLEDTYKDFKKNHKEGEEIPAVFALNIKKIISHENLK